MVAVITGDIINSQGSPIQRALETLKSVLHTYGENPREWEIYRGDSFQLLLKHPEESLRVAMHIKAALRMVKKRDARMAIGIGNVGYSSSRVTESNGDAFVRSGRMFEKIEKEKLNLAVQSPWVELDEEINLFFRFALIAMDDWTVASAEYMELILTTNELSQEEIAARLGISQSSASERKKRAHHEILSKLDLRFRQRLKGESM